ncbi:HIT domain-containing protein [Candidatus Micrarchaeota archaeon]|nr:HIT domain-containing protein [Candidatus Micrarchaeota archaeon]
MKKGSCSFCDYRDRKAVIYSDSECYAAVSYRPINDYHALIIPKQHYVSLTDRLTSWPPTFS